jgi:adenosylcobinamide-phosphate synthase
VPSGSMGYHFWLTLVALAIDGALGDPRAIPHPVVGMGWLVQQLEARWNRPDWSRTWRRMLGICLAAIVVCLSGGVTWLGLIEVAHVSWMLRDVAEVWLISTTIAWRGLVDAGWEVYQRLTRDGLGPAREAVGRIVGRDTAHLTEPEVVRAAVETLAENIVDAIVSPVFYAVIGGAPLAMAYRAANTLDSMVGYKSERYRDFGWASARLDDVANFIPARITAVFLCLAAWLCGEDACAAWRTIRRDARRHPSPNSGIPEAGMAGALGVQLGGLNYYGGVPSERARLGDARRPLEAADIGRAIRIVHAVTGILAVLVAIGGIVAWLVFAS